jgi:LacI family transcriptional regulator
MTAKELAEKLNLSAAAVSMALNNKPGVGEETRKKVLSAAKAYGLDITAAQSRQPMKETICFINYRRQGAVVGDTPFFAQLQEGIETGCKEAGFRLRVSYMHRSDDISRQLTEITHSDCSGIILLGTEMLPEDYAPFISTTMPLVMLDVYFDTVKHDCVLINNIQGAFLATDYLITRTGKQPGYLHSSYSIPNFNERTDGFYKAVRHNGMSTSKSIVHRLTPSVDGAFMDMTELLNSGEETAACYFADNDWIAIGAMKAFQQKGIKIPDDISIIGFDNIPSANYVEPSLTTVNVPKQYMGEMAIRRLVEIITLKINTPVKIEIATNLVLRKSIK